MLYFRYPYLISKKTIYVVVKLYQFWINSHSCQSRFKLLKWLLITDVLQIDAIINMSGIKIKMVKLINDALCEFVTLCSYPWGIFIYEGP